MMYELRFRQEEVKNWIQHTELDVWRPHKSGSDVSLNIYYWLLYAWEVGAVQRR